MSPQIGLFETLALGLGLVLVIEGLVLALAPDIYERMAQMLKDTPLETRRNWGLVAVALGVVLLWLMRG